MDGGAGIPHFKYVSYCAYLASISTMEGEIDPVQHEQHYDFLSNRIENAKRNLTMEMIFTRDFRVSGRIWKRNDSIWRNPARER